METRLQEHLDECLITQFRSIISSTKNYALASNDMPILVSCVVGYLQVSIGQRYPEELGFCKY